jgi:threonine dehydrogenase-like Zn-dependent dehydrogenase
MENGLTIKGAFACRREDTAQTIKLIEAGNLKLRKNVLGPFPLDDFSSTMELAEKSGGWDKMVVLGGGAL